MRDEWNDQVIAEIADLVVYQSVLLPQARNGKILAGVEHIMIDPAYAALEPDFDGPIVVSLGGSDPHGLTPHVMAALVGVERKIVIINGAAATPIDDEAVTIVHAPDSLLPYLKGASLLIGSLGMTAYEAAAAGVPTLLTSWSDDHLRTALELEKRGICVNIGRWDQFDADDLRATVDDLLSNKSAWQAMSEAGKALVDGHGVKRVADRIVSLLDPLNVIVPDMLPQVQVETSPEMGKPSATSRKQRRGG